MVGRCITVGYDTAVPTLLISNLAIFSSVVSCHNSVFYKIGLDDVTVHRTVLNFRGSLISQILQIFNRLQKCFHKNSCCTTQFSCSDCNSVDEHYPGTKLPNPQGTISKEAPSK